MKLSPPLKAAAVVSGRAVGSIGLWILNFARKPLSKDSARLAEFGSYLEGTLAPILAFASFIGLIVSIDHPAGQRQEESQRIEAMNHFQDATKSLERAFDTFVDREGAPISDRLVWLTVGRLILSARAIAARIELPSVKEMYEAEEEYWRRRFYNAIQAMTIQSPLPNPDWFRQGEQRLPGNIIDEQSIKVIFDFTEWPQGQPDPFDAIARYTDAELGPLRGGRAGAREYITAKRQNPING